MRLALSALVALVLLVAAPGRAQRRRARPSPPPPAGVALRVTPAEGELAGRYRFVVELTPTEWSPAEVIADRRLLSFTLTSTEASPRRRRRGTECRHPDAPRRGEEARTLTLTRGGDATVWREWIDLRSYCFGRALDALDRGASVAVHYGYTRRTRRGTSWIARPEGSEDGGVATIEGGTFEVAAAPEPPELEGAMRVSLSRGDASTEEGLSLRPRVRAASGSPRVYLRDDLWRFRIDGPLGRHECGMERLDIVPIVDFYSRVSARRGSSTSILASIACPGAFEVEGVYDVTPILDLVYDGSRYEFEAVTGTFEGHSVPIRIRRGTRPYVDQVVPVEAPARAAAPAATPVRGPTPVRSSGRGPAPIPPPTRPRRTRAP